MITNELFNKRFIVLEEDIYSATATEEYSHLTKVQDRITGFKYYVNKQYKEIYDLHAEEQLNKMSPDPEDIDDPETCLLMIIFENEDGTFLYVSY